jgi:hypothetical protein
MTDFGKRGGLKSTLSGLPACRGINGSLQSAADLLRSMFADRSSARAAGQVFQQLNSPNVRFREKDAETRQAA